MIYLLSEVHMHFISLPCMESAALELTIPCPEKNKDPEGVADEGCRAALLSQSNLLQHLSVLSSSHPWLSHSRALQGCVGKS